MSETNGTYVWHALSLMLTFLFYGLISFPELIAWALYMDGYYDFARWYFTTIGYWGTIFAYPLPAIFELIHLVYYDIKTFPGTWAVYQIVFSVLVWVTTMLLHIYYIDPFVTFMDSRQRQECICSAPEILDIAPNADRETKLAWEFAIEQREKVCAIECPIKVIEEECGLERNPDISDLEYEAACEAYRRDLKAELGEGAGEEDEDEDEFDFEEEEGETEGW